MATITDLPYELLYHIIILLVQSSVGAADFARFISVCKKFLMFREDELLKFVNFDKKIELKNFYKYQNVNGLLVKCSEAGNVSAQFLLGKVILVSSSQLLLREWQKAECDVHPCDHLTLCDLKSILAVNVNAQNSRVDSFMTHFLPKEVSTSGSSYTRWVYDELIYLFLLSGSHRDLVEKLVEISAFLKSYILQFSSVTYAGGPLFRYISALVASANRVRDYENMLVHINCVDGGCEGCSRATADYIDRAYNGFAESRKQTILMFEMYGA